MEKKPNKKKGKAELVKTIRHGAIAANIWQRQTQTGFPYFDYSLSRSWKSSTAGKEGYSQNYFTQNADQLLACVAAATKWIQEQVVEEFQPATNTNTEPAQEAA